MTVPGAGAGLIERSRLLSMGAATTGGSNCGPARPAPVVLVCAPAGYGKTTALVALAEAEAAAGHPVAWVTCERDEDETSFWSAVLAAFSRAVPGSATVLAEVHVPVGSIDVSFVDHVVEVILDAAPGLVLVLDDVHELKGRGLLDGVMQLIEATGGGLRLAIGCRFEPPLSLYRLRLTGRLHEIRARDLAFTVGEAADVWRTQDLHLSGPDRETLHRLTEGWPAAVRLASLALRHESDRTRFIADFNGATQPVWDYLTGEVLARLPADVVDFLMRTSIVEHLPADLANDLSGRADALDLLQELTERNALVTQVDSPGASYRYHVLLRTHLVAALHRRNPGEAAELRRVAAQWFTEHGDPAKALEMALLADEALLVESLLRTHGLRMLLDGTGRSIRQATRARSDLPTSPTILVHRALLAVEDGDGIAADESLAALCAIADDGTDARVTSLRKLAVLHRARLAADLSAAAASGLVAGDTPADLPIGLDPDVRLLVLADRGALRLFAGDHLGALQDLRHAKQLATAGSLDSIRLYCTTLLAGSQLAANDFRAARTAAEDAISIATRRGWDRAPAMAYPYALAGWASFQELEPDTAADFADVTRDVVDTTLDVALEGAARAIAATISFDDPLHRRTALTQMKRATDRLGERGAPATLTALLAPHELRMCLELGEWRLAGTCVERAEERLGTTGDVAVLQAHLATARGRPGDAQRLLRPVLNGELTPLRNTATIAAWLLEALLATRADRRPAATEALMTALVAVKGSAAYRVFFDAGAEVHLLLAGLEGRAGHLDGELRETLSGIKRVIRWQEAARAAKGGPSAAPNAPTIPARYLSERELVFLRELPSMMTLAEIADAHGVSINTAKTHVRSVYNKLSAKTRREAIATGRALELL